MARCQPLGFATTGAVYGGTGPILRLYENDGGRVEISAASTSSGYVSELRPYARISSAQRASLKKLTVDYDGHATSRSASLTLRIFNFATGTWQTIDGPRTGVTADRAFTWSNATAPGSYVSSTGEVRVSVLGRGSGSFRTRTDLIRLSIDS